MSKPAKRKDNPSGHSSHIIWWIIIIFVVLFAIKYFWPLLIVLLTAYIVYAIYKLTHPQQSPQPSQPMPEAPVVPAAPASAAPVVSVSPLSGVVLEPTPQELQEQRYDAVQKIKNLQKEAIPSPNGLYPQEILMLSYAKWYSVGQTGFPQFWYYQYAVSDPGKVLMSLSEKGFIRPETAAEALPRLTVAQLRELLASQGLPAKGKKADLVAFASANVTPAALDGAVATRKYTLTELGEAELKTNAYIPYLHSHKNLNISIWEMNKTIQSHPEHYWRDLVWGELQSQTLSAMKYIQNGNWSPYIHLKYQQADFLADEGKIKESLRTLLFTLHDQLNHEFPRYFLSEIDLRTKGIKEDAAPAFSEIAIQNDYGFKKISQALQTLSPDKGTRESLLLDLCERKDMPSALFSATDFVSLIIAYTDNNLARFSELCNAAQPKLLNKK